MRREITAEKSAEPDAQSGEDAAIDARLTDYIRANAIRIERPTPSRHSGRSAAILIATPLLYVLGVITFGFVVVVSYVCGLVERRQSTRLWDGLGLPVAADRRDGEEDAGVDSRN
jgi:hypothetical protein